MWSNSLLKQGHLDQVAQDHAQSGSECLQGWRLHNLSVRSVPVFDHPHSKKNVLLYSDSISYFGVFAGCFLFCRWTLVRRVTILPSLLFIPTFQVFQNTFQVFIHIGKTPLSLLQVQQSHLSQHLLLRQVLKSIKRALC